MPRVQARRKQESQTSGKCDAFGARLGIEFGHREGAGSLTHGTAPRFGTKTLSWPLLEQSQIDLSATTIKNVIATAATTVKG